jgi:hypothetical protein
MKDLILAEDDRIAPCRDGDRMANRLFRGQCRAAARECDIAGQLIRIVRAHQVALDAVTGFDHERPAGVLVPESGCEPLALDRGHVTGMCDKRKDRPLRALTHSFRPASGVTVAGSPRPRRPVAVV